MTPRAIGPAAVSQEEWRRLEPVIDAALDMPADERDAYIASQYGNDAATLAAVRQMIDECGQVHPILDRDALENFPELLEDDDSPDFPELLAGRYRVTHEIGRGGMAVVYLARDLTHERDVAVKVMRASIHSVLGAERFLAEIRTTAGLRHPHIVPVYDSGEWDGHLFFVMPYYEGETLAGRLARQPVLDVGEALQIASDLASALAHAHSAGLVHRDIKPSNVLFSSGHALLADFGIARAAGATARDLTAVGTVIGTPGYMSPEQQSGARAIDARSDIYNMGCLLYEMLSGMPPGSASTREVLARHGVEDTRSLRSVRPDLSQSLLECVARAMALPVDERFESAEAFSLSLAACANERGSERPARATLRWNATVVRRAAGVIVAMVVVATVALLAVRRAAVGGATPANTTSLAAAGDSSRYLLLPYEPGPGTNAVQGDDDPLSDAMLRWQGVTVVDGFQLDGILSSYPKRPLREEAARAVAARVGAGRYVRRRFSMKGGRSIISATLFDARSGNTIVNAMIVVPPDAHGLDSAFRALSNTLLFPRAAIGSSTARDLGTSSRPAFLAFQLGSDAVAQWNLAAADSQFVAATETDADFARAHLRLAQVRVWRGVPAAAWRFEVEHALKGRDALSAADRQLADALHYYAAGDSSRACATWVAESRKTAEFAALYGAALCQARDRAILRDPKSPSGWRFRSSASAASTLLSRAFQILPAIHREFRGSWYAELGTILSTKPTQLRYGRALAPDTGLFAAYPSWSTSGDSLTTIPYRLGDFAAQQPWTIPPSRGEAIRHQRTLVRDIAITWHTAFARSADAMLALAIAMDDLGDPASLDSLERAREFAFTPEERLRTGAAEVWLRVKLGVPSNLHSLTIARTLADSLLRSYTNPHGRDARALASLAMLVGRPAQAAALARLESTDDDITPGSIRLSGQALLAFSAAGSPAESIRVLESEVLAATQASVELARRTGVKRRWLARPLTLSFPTYQTRTILELAKEGDAMATLEAAWINADTIAVRKGLQKLEIGRRASAPENLKLEAAYPEAWLLASLGDSAGAADRLAAPLGAQARSSIEVLYNVAGAGALIRAMALHATLAGRRGDRESARRWAEAVIALWSDADRHLLDSVVRPMKQLVR